MCVWRGGGGGGAGGGEACVRVCVVSLTCIFSGFAWKGRRGGGEKRKQTKRGYPSSLSVNIYTKGIWKEWLVFPYVITSHQK